MVQVLKILVAAAATAVVLFDVVTAHRGGQHQALTAAEHTQRKLFIESGRRSLAACATSDHARLLQERAFERRTAKIQQLRSEHAARRLNADTVIAKSHKSTLTGVTKDTAPAILFGDDVKCILEPEVTEGPYYVAGELLRSDIREKQAGVDLYTEIQIIDVNTCKPVADLYLDFWHCNSTGVYAGVVAGGNGNTADASNINATFNRGLAPTDKDGLATFLTTFPGHYTGRAPHIHVMGSHGGSLLPNNTYVGSSASHVGQIFFDQDLIASVETTSPYVTNKQPLTLNAKDGIFIQSAATGFDPVVEYALLGNKVEDGIFSWISIGVDSTISKQVSAAARLTENGGVATGNGGGGGGPPPFGSGSGFPPPFGSGSGFPAPPPSSSGSGSGTIPPRDGCYSE